MKVQPLNVQAGPADGDFKFFFGDAVGDTKS